MKRTAVLGIIFASVTTTLIGATQASATSTSAQVAIFHTYVNTVKKDLSRCTASTSNVQIEWGILRKEGSHASKSDYAQLNGAIKTAQTACNDAENQDVVNLIDLAVPAQITWVESLTNTGSEADNWASTDTIKVLHDIQSIAKSNRNTVPRTSPLNTDVATANADAASLGTAFLQTARRLHTSFSGLGLVVWS